MRKLLLSLAFIGLLISCKSKKPSLSGTEAVDIADFISFFPTLKLPYQTSDSIFNRHTSDSLIIGKPVFSQFVPDSVMAEEYGKSFPKIYPVGKVVVPKAETYLFIRASSAAKKTFWVLCFDKKNRFAAAKPLIISSADIKSGWQAGIDNKYTIYSTRLRKSAEGDMYFRKSSFVFAEGTGLALILNESNEPAPKNAAIYNPIDTFPRKNKLAGDYMQDKRNFVSVRDGRDAAHVAMFIHFEKNDGDCKGELKGTAKLTSANKAHYSAAGDPCSIDFTFSGEKLVMREIEGCGNYRGIKCSFDGTYLKKKEGKLKPTKKKTGGTTTTKTQR